MQHVLAVSRQLVPEDTDQAMVAGVSFWREKTDLCFSHQCFGHKARKRQRQRSVAAMGIGEQEQLLFVKYSLSGWWFLVDSGSQKSLLPPGGVNLSSSGAGSQLTATNGSSIETFGTR